MLILLYKFPRKIIVIRDVIVPGANLNDPIPKHVSNDGLVDPFCSTVGTSKTPLRSPPSMLKPAMAESVSGFTLQPCLNASDLAAALMGGCGTDPRRSV